MSRIIIVDDSPIIHRLLSTRLVAAGHTVLACGSDGNEGVALFKSLDPDLVLLDVTMPNCDGRESLRQILLFKSSAKVVMVSAIADPTVIAECLKCGATDFLSKDRLAEKGYLEEIISRNLPKSAA